MALTAVWIIGGVFACLPFIINHYQDETHNTAFDIQVANVQCSHYSLFSCQTSMLSDGTLIVITISALIPLAMVWAVNIWLYISVRQSQRESIQKVTATAMEEIKLARTLATMVFAFTIAVLPFTMICIAAFFIEDITYSSDGYDGTKANKYNTFSTIRLAVNITYSCCYFKCAPAADEFYIQLHDIHLL